MEKRSFLDRTFQLWEYRVGHGSLLIRSPKNTKIKTNVDLIFRGVEYLSVPRFFRGIEFKEATHKDIQKLTNKLGRQVLVHAVHVFVSDEHRFYVVAANFQIEENEKDIFNSPFDY